MSRIQDDQVDYLTIPLDCPKCGLHGWTLVTRADRRFQCKRCKAKFYIDRRGDITTEKPTVAPDKSLRRSVDPLGAVVSWWEKQSRFARVALSTTAVLLLGAAAVWVFRPGPDLPQSLPARAAFVADAFARNRSDLLRTVTVPETSHVIDAWLKAKRLASWGQTVSADKSVDVDVHVLAENFTQGTALVRVRIAVGKEAVRQVAEMVPSEKTEVEKAAPVSSQTPNSEGEERIAMGTDLILFWKMDKSGHWLLDCSTSMNDKRRG